MGTNEIWLPVTEQRFSLNYEVSNLGRVRNVNGYVRKATRNKKNGYFYVTLSVGNKGRNCTVHRLVALAFIGPPPEGKTDVNHKDSNRTNNRLDNLEWMSRKENSRHGVMEGHYPTGSAHHNHGKVLSDEYRRKISESMKRRWEDPEFASRHKTSMERARARQTH